MKTKKIVKNSGNFAAFGPLELKHLFDTYNTAKGKESNAAIGKLQGNIGVKKVSGPTINK